MKVLAVLLAPFAVVAGLAFALWHLPAALVVWLTYRIPISSGGGFLTSVSGYIVALLWIASYAWPVAVIYGANQL